MCVEERRRRLVMGEGIRAGIVRSFSYFEEGKWSGSIWRCSRKKEVVLCDGRCALSLWGKQERKVVVAG